MIGALLGVSVPGFALGALGLALAARGAPPQVARERWLKFAVFCAIVHAVLGAALLGTGPLRALMLGVLCACVVEFARAWRILPRPRPRRAAIGAALLAAGAATAVGRHDAATLVWCYLVTACADGFAQVVGQLLGRHPLAPRLSPGKTVEGAAGGLCAAAIGSVALRGVVALGPGAAAAWGGALALAGLAGDLGASWLKRRAGIKDYSRLLPGQGGFLDRFDSLVAALALLAVVGPSPG